MNLNLYVVDDDKAVRDSLGVLLLSRGYAVQTFDSAEAFLKSSHHLQSGCLILDLRLEGMSGLEVQDALMAAGSTLVILFLSGHGDIEVAVKAVQKGAFGWLEKPCSEASLLQKVSQALERTKTLATQHQAQLAAYSRWQKLTPREKEISKLVAEGKTSKLIARELATIDPRTVDTHRAHIFAKLGCANSNELDRFLHQYGLINNPML
jgi:FixJ family two-component response regulator